MNFSLTLQFVPVRAVLRRRTGDAPDRSGTMFFHYSRAERRKHKIAVIGPFRPVPTPRSRPPATHGGEPSPTPIILQLGRFGFPSLPPVFLDFPAHLRADLVIRVLNLLPELLDHAGLPCGKA